MLRRWRQRAGACLPSSPPPREKSVCKDTRESQQTLRAGAHQIGQRPDEKEACQDTRVSQYTLRDGAQHSGRRGTRVRRRYTSQIVTDGVPTRTTSFVHAGAWIVTLNMLCGVLAHTTTVVHAGA